MNKMKIEQRPEQYENVGDFWEKMDADLPANLKDTSFKIPYEPISVRQLVTRAEFAREI